jgi:hypothetical protein
MILNAKNCGVQSKIISQFAANLSLFELEVLKEYLSSQ